MTAIFLIRAFLVLPVLIGVESAHGILRTLLLVPLIGDVPALWTIFFVH